MKRLFQCILTGFGVAAGASLFNKLVGVMKDPVKKANWKRKFNNIKNEIFKKDEE